MFALTGMSLTCMGQARAPAPKIQIPAAPTSPQPRPRTKRHRLMKLLATGYSVSGTTAKGTETHKGIVAADPSILPLGSLIRVTGAGAYSGIYTVTDTGEKVQGRHIDIYMPSGKEATRFGRRMVYVRIILRGDNSRDHKEISLAEPMRPAQQAAAAPANGN